MTQAIDTSRGRVGVVESYVTLTLLNDEGKYLRVRRWPKSLEVSPNLVQVFVADSEAELSTARRQDMFVREGGSTYSALGFHRLLEEFIGWSLPLVPDFSGGDTRLYLEVIFPLFYVEQKFGWSGVAPRIPTHYRIRDPLQRAVEYVLGLSTLDLIRAREALKEEESRIVGEWAADVASLNGAASAENLRVELLDSRPVGAAQRHSPTLEANDQGQWISLESAEALWRAQLEALRGPIVTAGERSSMTRADLEAAEADVRKIGATVRDLSEQVTVSGADQDALSARLAGVEQDKQRLRDIQRVRTLGGELDLPLISEGRCPTCQQEVDGRDVASGTVSSIEDNIVLLDAERVTLLAMQTAAAERSVRLAASKEAAEADLAAARDRVRLLRDELVGPSSAPSLSEVQQRLALESRLRGAAGVKDICAAVDDELFELSVRFDDIRVRRARLGDQAVSAVNAEILASFRDSFQKQLASYGLGSLRLVKRRSTIVHCCR